MIATGISFGAMLNSRFDLITIESLGGIPPGRWYISLSLSLFLSLSLSLCLSLSISSLSLSPPSLPPLSPPPPLSLFLQTLCSLHKTCIHSDVHTYTFSYGLDGHGITTPKPSLMKQLISDAFIIAIISFVINISQAKLLAKKNSYSVHPDQVNMDIVKTSSISSCVCDHTIYTIYRPLIHHVCNTHNIITTT